MQHQLLERVPALRRDQEPVSAAAGDEGLLDGASPGDELLVLGERFDDGRRVRTADGADAAETADHAPQGRWSTHGRRGPGGTPGSRGPR